MNIAIKNIWLIATAAAFLWTAAPAGTPADPAAQPKPTSDSDPFPISARAAPAVVLIASAAKSSNTLTISGETMAAGQRAVTISIASETGAVVSTDRVRPDGKGHFSFAPRPPAQAGVYHVTVTAPDGRGKTETTFRAVAPSGLGRQAETILNDADAAADEAVKAAEAKIDSLADSPAKDQAKKQLADAKRSLREVRASDSSNSVGFTIGAIGSDAAMQESFGPRLDALTSSFDEVAKETERVRKLTAEMSSADIGCHQLAVVSEVFKGAAALLSVKMKVVLAVGGIAKDYIDASYARRTGKPAAAPAPPSPQSEDGPSVVKKYEPAVKLATKAIGGAVPFFTNLGAYVTNSVFGAYCEQFVGPVEGIMNARFFTSSSAANPLTMWWSYNYQITGRIILYYPKDAKGGGPVRLTGRIEGYAHGFKTWEDALTVFYPRLMAGTMQHKFNYPPIEADDIPSPAGKAAPGSDYVGSSAASLAIPNSFLIDVNGVLEKDTMTVVLGAAESDLSAQHRVAVVILAPMVGGLGPQITWYPLPFQKARQFIKNAADGDSMRLTLKTQAAVMTADGVFTGTIDKPTAKGDYTLKIKACNPGC